MKEHSHSKTASLYTTSSYGSHHQINDNETKQTFIKGSNPSKCSCLTKLIPPWIVWCIAFYALCGSSVTIMTVSWIAWYTDLPFIFPSLGASTFLHFAIPDQPPASPRNTLCSHFVGGLMGYIGLIITGLAEEPVVFVRDDNIIIMARVACLTFAIGTTCFFMILFNIGHPPAGATTIIFALGILRTIPDLAVLMASALILCMETWFITKIFRQDMIYPFWTNMTSKQRNPANIEDDPQVFVSKKNSLERGNIEDDPRVFVSERNLLERAKPIAKQSNVSIFQRQSSSRLVLLPKTK